MPKPSPEKIRAVLDDLYALDPSLRDQGSELEQAVATLLAARPDTEINKQFVNTLRKKLILMETPSASPQTFMEKLSLKFLLPTAAVATVAVALAVVVTQPGLLPSSGPLKPSTAVQNPLFASGVRVTATEANAFGLLASTANGMGGDLGSAEAVSMRTQSGGGGSSAMSPVPMAPPATANDADAKVRGEAYAVSEPSSLIAPDYTYERIRYTYDGPELQLDSTGSVYRRVKRALSSADLGGALSGLNLGILDLSRFGNAALQQFTLVQPGEYGYQIYVDLNEGNVSINQNYQSWPHPEALCRDEACFARTRLSQEDVKDDAALIAVTDAFLADHGISKDGFGAPMVDRRWNMVQPYMKAAADTRMMYVPEAVSVMYPIQLDGKTSYDQSGFPYGLSVSVDIRSQRVSGVWNLVPQEYQSSSYDLVSDAKQILDVVSRGDVYAPPFGQDPNERVRDLKLGEPTRILMQSWHQREDGMGEELLVPALRFPVIPDADGYTGYRDAVVVPLVKDLLTPPVIMYRGMGGEAVNTSPANPPAGATDPVAMPAETMPTPGSNPAPDMKQ